MPISAQHGSLLVRDYFPEASQWRSGKDSNWNIKMERLADCLPLNPLRTLLLQTSLIPPGAMAYHSSTYIFPESSSLWRYLQHASIPQIEGYYRDHYDDLKDFFGSPNFLLVFPYATPNRLPPIRYIVRYRTIIAEEIQNLTFMSFSLESSCRLRRR